MPPDCGSPETDHAPTPVKPDMEELIAELDDLDISPEAKEEFVRTLGNVLLAFVELGFGLHPMQQHQQNPNENAVKNEDSLLFSISDVLCLSTSNRTPINDRSGPSNEEPAGEKGES
ncbi:hypothetical protein FF098_016465 [Parvularcula flava]|uniref:Uncharacterized protein n=1 Tax=Aquisalinus luteolus TaxID=1566827 RepID=A0A8J3EVU5_9PROT|nr:hypothetical protein [Aquisalinus luteolus]NHK29504.1 hypothetical protein [Aquisalinus luteolus]GGI01740.1 hypothetical protein GCM10011355_33090 [Aquisalinus luteolus]